MHRSFAARSNQVFNFQAAQAEAFPKFLNALDGGGPFADSVVIRAGKPSCGPSGGKWAISSSASANEFDSPPVVTMSSTSAPSATGGGDEGTKTPLRKMA
jgi:hypothetical protein